MQFSLSSREHSVSFLEQYQSRAPKSWPQWMQLAATLLTGSLAHNNSKKNNQFSVPNAEKSFLKLRGHLGGEIYYVSPPLNSFSNGERIITLPTRIRDRANEIIESEEAMKQYGARAVELLCPIRPSKGGFFGDENEKDLDVSTVDDYGTKGYDTSRDIADEKLAEIPARKQIRILSIISELVRNNPAHKDAVIFFEEDGMVGLAPVGTKVGDIVCRVEKSDAVAIVREHEGDFWVIARAMNLSPLTMIDRSCPEVVFDMDVEDMNLLTRTSNCD